MIADGGAPQVFDVVDALARQATVVLIGARQVGKTTLAHAVAEKQESLYLDLEAREDREKLVEAALFLRNYESRLRLWTMLAHGQGTLMNASRLAGALMLSAQTATRYIDLLVDLLLVRRLRPFHSNPRKRLVKSPKLYVRDSGILHGLLGIPDHNTLAGHPVVGATGRASSSKIS